MDIIGGLANGFWVALQPVNLLPTSVGRIGAVSRGLAAAGAACRRGVLASDKRRSR